MKIEQSIFTTSGSWVQSTPCSLSESAQLVLVFGETSVIKNPARFKELKNRYPKAYIFGCSTAGEIAGMQVLDDSLVATAIAFEATTVRLACESIDDIHHSRRVGRSLAGKLVHQGLVHVFVLSDGIKVNGSALVEGISESLPAHVTLTGGLSADMDRFNETLVMCNSEPARDIVGVLGLYSERLSIGYGSFGGWDPFGPERLVTRSQDNILYELDGKSALGLYQTYLGDHAKGLPATGLLFPLSIRLKDRPSRLVRTVLSVDDSTQTMTFAGDIPEGSYAQFMKANINRLIDGAMEAAKMSRQGAADHDAELAVLISCVGRKMVLKQRVEEEVEAVQGSIGNGAVLTGFYSYGEISPTGFEQSCELHNQTMTITTFRET